jgi:hypothetical protein
MAPAPRSGPGATTVPLGQRLGIAGCPMFPADHPFNASVDALPVAVDSQRIIESMGPTSALRPGFGSTVNEGSRRGYPINVIDPATAVTSDFITAAVYQYYSDGTAVPMPPVPRFEGWPGRAWDKHLLLVDPTTCRTRELINVQPPGENESARSTGKWYADAVVSYDLRSDERPIASVNAAGTSMLAGLVRYDEVAGGIHHAIGITLPDIRRDEFRWPTHHTDGRSDDPNSPPMGAWFRLRDDVDISTFPPQARAVAQALRDHGGIVVDTGPGITLTGEPDLRWNDSDLSALTSLTAADLEVVDPSSLMIDPEVDRARTGA